MKVSAVVSRNGPQAGLLPHTMEDLPVLQVTAVIGVFRRICYKLAAWRSGNALSEISEITLAGPITTLDG